MSRHSLQAAGLRVCVCSALLHQAHRVGLVTFLTASSTSGVDTAMHRKLGVILVKIKFVMSVSKCLSVLSDFVVVLAFYFFTDLLHKSVKRYPVSFVFRGDYCFRTK